MNKENLPSRSVGKIIITHLFKEKWIKKNFYCDFNFSNCFVNWFYSGS